MRWPTRTFSGLVLMHLRHFFVCLFVGLSVYWRFVDLVSFGVFINVYFCLSIGIIINFLKIFFWFFTLLFYFKFSDLFIFHLFVYYLLLNVYWFSLFLLSLVRGVSSYSLCTYLFFLVFFFAFVISYLPNIWLSIFFFLHSQTFLFFSIPLSREKTLIYIFSSVFFIHNSFHLEIQLWRRKRGLLRAFI